MTRTAAVIAFLRGLAGVFDRQEFGPLPFKTLAEFARMADVPALFLDELGRARQLDRLDAAQRQALVSAAAKTALWNQGYLDELARLAEALGRVGVKFTVVRGPVLVFRAYGDPLKRRFTDLDLIVPSDRVAEALRALEGLGYRTARRTERDIERRGWKGVIELVRDGGARQFDVDLHTSLLNRRRLQPIFSIEDLNAASERVTETLPGMGAVPALSLEDELIYAIVHLALQHQMSDLRSFLDCVLLVHRNGERLDWTRLLARARDAGCEKLVSCVLALIVRMIPRPTSRALAAAAAWGEQCLSCYPLSKFFSVHYCIRALRDRDLRAWQWVAERQSLFYVVDHLHTAIAQALTESVPSAWRIRRLRSRKLSGIKTIFWSIPMAAILPLYIPILLGHAVVVRWLEAVIPVGRRSSAAPPPLLKASPG